MAQHILLVDDEEEIRVFVRSFLEDLYPKARFTMVDNGGEGVVKSLEEKYDLIITDHNMPFKKGVEMVVEIKSNRTNPNQQTPIIVLSGFLDDEIRSFLKSHKVAFTDKPIDFGVLTQELESLGL